MSDVVKRVVVMGEMHGRDLLRRRAALALLVALPLSFYLAASSRGAAVGGVGMAFAVSGASLFSVLSSREVDQRLVLAGYRPVELLLGRVLPFYGARRLIDSGLHQHGAIAGPVLQTAVYALVLLVVARLVLSRHMVVERHDLLD